MSLTLAEIAEAMMEDDDFEAMLEQGVRDTASVLDEHVPDWSYRITRPLEMGCIFGCVLGQVFKENPDEDLLGNGWMRGSIFLHERGIPERPFVFTAVEAAPYWNAEIAKRTELVAV
jgi:hypothetical protein